MFDYMAHSLVWLVSIFAGTPLTIKAGLTFLKITQSDPSIPLKEKFYRSVRRLSFYGAMLGALTCGIVIAFILAGSCITVHGPNVDGTWIPLAGTLRWNSRMMRSFSPSPCPGPGPCHVYLTAGSDLTSEVFVNVHLPLDAGAQFLTVNLNNGGLVVNATEFSMPLLDSHDQRIVFSAYLGSLSAGTENSFTLSTDKSPVGESVFEFKLPSLSEATFVVAGNAGVTDNTDQIMAQMIARKPDLAIIGGDVAYDNGFISCACTWDSFLDMWEAKRVDGRLLVPLSFGAGNRDLAVNYNNKGAFDLPENHAVWTVNVWFPNETVLDSSSVPEPAPVCSRSTLRKHSFGSLCECLDP
jgi:hypothetical protein